MDTMAILKILSMHNGCKENNDMNIKRAEEAITGVPIEMPKSKEELVEEEH